MKKGPRLYYEDVDLGDEVGPLDLDITTASVRGFCNLWGNSEANRFVDPEEAKQVGLTAPIVPGIMSMGLMSQLFTSWGPPNVLKKIDVVFRQPVFHGEVQIKAVVTDKTVENDQYLVECDVHLTNQEGDRLIGGKVVLSLPSNGS